MVEVHAIKVLKEKETTMRFIRKGFEIHICKTSLGSISRNTDRETVSGLVLGQYGCHKTDTNDFRGATTEFHVTHLPTGMKIESFSLRRDAMSLAEHLHRYALDVGSSAPWGCNTGDWIGSIGKVLQEYSGHFIQEKSLT